MNENEKVKITKIEGGYVVYVDPLNYARDMGEVISILITYGMEEQLDDENILKIRILSIGETLVL